MCPIRSDKTIAFIFQSRDLGKSDFKRVGSNQYMNDFVDSENHGIFLVARRIMFSQSI